MNQRYAIGEDPMTFVDRATGRTFCVQEYPAPIDEVSMDTDQHLLESVVEGLNLAGQLVG